MSTTIGQSVYKFDTDTDTHGRPVRVCFVVCIFALCLTARNIFSEDADALIYVFN